MDLSKRLSSLAYAAGAGTLVTMLAGKILAAAWRLITGNEPPNAEDAEVPLRTAAMWTLASAVGIALAQLLVARTIGKRVMSTVGKPTRTD